jgi:NTE family protein
MPALDGETAARPFKPIARSVRRELPGAVARAASSLLAVALLAGCATRIDNAPLNRAITRDASVRAAAPRSIVDAHVIGLSLSGGGLRAAAFGLGVM